MAPQSQLFYQPGVLRRDARELSRRHTYTKGGEDIIPIQPRLDQARKVLTRAYRVLARSVKHNRDISPAAEWLIDNFYVIQEQMVQIENDFPIDFQRNVPHLTSGPNKHLPRVYDLAHNLILHSDNVVDAENLTRYIRSYQEEATLEMGELWAVPVMVRLVLVEQLAAKASRVLNRRDVSTEVQEFATRLTEEDMGEPGWILRRVMEWMNARDDAYDNRLLITKLVHLLQNAGLIYEEEIRWFEYRLQKFGITLDEALRDEAQRESVLQISIQNAVVSLRQTSETEWQDFIEECSVTDQILRLDPMGIYPEMDARTKDEYRKTIERLSRYSEYSETEVAEEALLLAEPHANTAGRDDSPILFDYTVLKQHIGYYLLGEGYGELIRRIGYRMPLSERIRRRLEKLAGYYIGFVGLHTLLLLVVLWLATDAISHSWAASLGVLLAALFPAAELSVSAVNRIIAFWLPPRVLPRMKIKEGIPDESRTMVVIPTLINSPQDVRGQLEKLEITALANPDPGLQFILLSDFTDAGREHMPGDEAILKEAEKAIGELNDKYASRYGDKFFLFHRRRQWNPAENVWMGRERKRGKLEKLNEFLCDPSADSPFAYRFGDFSATMQEIPVEFVLTLDADTRTPPDSAIDLVRVASHPLNRAWYDEEKRRITKGYGIIQPRISIPPDAADKTWFTRIFSGNVGIDPYTTAVSDIYQDLMGEAVFTGKGIYDVRAFHTVMDNRFPENRILSHDLIESNYVRAGLSTEIELFDDYPSNYNSYCKRNHRWTRGDWQIAGWLLRRVPEAGGKVRNPLSLLSRWKIFDNLRRSLNPLFITLFFITGWFWLPGAAIIWTAAAFGILAFPIYMSLSSDMLNRPARIKWKLYLDKVRSNLKINTLQAVSTLAILPHQAVINLDAIVRSLWRLRVSRRNLLEWTSASQAEKMSSNTLTSYVRSMGVSALLGAGILVTAALVDPEDLWLIIPFSLLWMTSPVFAWYYSHPRPDKRSEISEGDKVRLRTYARRTWFYFERLVDEEHSWLPPDNYQEDPALPPTARTSPTNIGLMLVSTQVAYEMGYITLSELLMRLDKTLNSLIQLKRFKGHFYNWYDTRLGEVLSPHYISAVDSGNLAAGLIVIRQAMERLAETEYTGEAFWKGLDDTLETLRSVFADIRGRVDGSDEICQQLNTCIDQMQDKLQGGAPATISESLGRLEELKSAACILGGRSLMKLRSSLGDDHADDLQFWLETPLRQIENCKEELEQLRESSADDVFPVSLAAQIKDSPADTGGNGTYKIFGHWKRQIGTISAISDLLISEMDFSFLYNTQRGLFNIGYNVEKAEADKSTYDLLASEARIASVVAIAKGDVPSEHWFRLGRRLTSLNNNEFLLSWGGTTFEYLMPLLFMRAYPHTLLSHTYDHIVEWQRKYSRKTDRPWGFSESAYNILNIDMNYQYRTFGAPGLGLKRGLAEEFVVAPYASVLALMVQPETALHNLAKLDRIGSLGTKGYYDAVDFTPDHLPEKESFKVVKTYMAHHHGMSLIALHNVLNDWAISDYFHSDPQIKACELLLQERIPRGIPVKEPHPIDVEMEPGEQHSLHYVVDHAGIHDLDRAPPRVHLLSNGRYHSVISHTGSSRSAYEDLMLTGWKPDATEDPPGQFIYIKDLESGEYWSAFHQPVRRRPDRYDTWFHNGKVQTSRVDEWIETTTEVCVSPEYPVELRRVTLTNYADHPRTLELTSYAEVVLNRAEDHNAHPAFSKLFVQTDSLAEHHGVMAWRRPRSDEEEPVYMVHMVASHDLVNLTEPLQFETERSRFIGRGRTLMNPLALDPGHALSGSRGNVSDPILSLRRKITLAPGEKVQVTFGTGRAGSRQEAAELADTFDNLYAVERAFDLASIYNTVELEHIGISSRRFQYFQKLAGYMLYNDKRFRAGEETLIRNRRKQSDLWAYGISGDRPLMVFRISKPGQMNTLGKLLKGHQFWKHRGLRTDLVILNDHPPSYTDSLQEGILQAVQASRGSHTEPREDDIFMLRSDRMPEEDINLILTVASVVIDGSLPGIDPPEGSRETKSFAGGVRTTTYKPVPAAEAKVPKEAGAGLQFFNGYGGFAEEGREYRILVQPDSERGQLTLPPAPWINVIANPGFGFLAAESGAGYTWSVNSRENKLTSWSNDPLLDPPSEAFYIRDEENRRYWSPTPGPVPGQNGYEVSHGFGYTRYRHISLDIESELLQFVPESDPVKISRLVLRNRGAERRRLSLFSYHEWVLGTERESAARYVTQEASEGGAALYARNHYNNEFAGRTAFAASVGVPGGESGTSFATDRQAFIGRNRSLKNPLAVEEQAGLDGEVKNGGDPCTVLLMEVLLEPGEEIEGTVLMGEAATKEKADNLIQKYRSSEQVEKAFRGITRFWESRLSRIQVETPDLSLNLMMNGWLMYQNIACRMWSRTAFYQSGGAFGYRDQLQDAMAALYANPALTRQQILLHAARQFPEGDVQHWWHPPTGRGVRTRISDDRLWLPYAVHFYIESAGDADILEEVLPWLEARGLEDHEHDAYLQPAVSNGNGTLYEHCIRAIDVSLKTGTHGLPLIGTGDWNDGMDRVGPEGRGESVWLGFFLCDILEKFIPFCKTMGDEERADHYKAEARKLARHLNTEGWDGNWYLRAFYDDGSPLGSARNEEARIDAISQAWSVISGVAPQNKKLMALAALEKHLVSEQDRVIRLLTPPFDRTEQNPGYIKGYIPGVRENGGQYTHAALWAVRAFAEAGFGDKAVKYIQMINPVNHALSSMEADKYKVEPYVAAADVYGEPPLTGQGGWTWYTGSAGWMYRVVLESVLGLRIKGEILSVKPSISSDWKTYSICWKLKDGKTVYRIEVGNPERLETGRLEGMVDGRPVRFPEGEAEIELKHDGQTHTVVLGLVSKGRV